MCSLLFCTLITYRFVAFERLRLYPARIVMYKTVLEVVASCVVIAQVVAHPQSEDDRLHRVFSGCAPFSFFLQYCWIGSELCFGAMSVNLFKAIKTPFARPESFSRHAFVFINCVALISGVVVAGKHDAQRSLFKVCYISPRGSHNESAMHPNTVTLIVFYIPLLLNWLVSVGVAFFAFLRLRRSLPDTFLPKRQALIRERNSLMVYTVFWITTASLYLDSVRHHVDDQQGPDSERYTFHNASVPIAFTFLFMSKSVVSLLLSFSQSSAQESSSSASGPAVIGAVNEDSLLLNKALQRELVACIRLGLTYSVHDVVHTASGAVWCEVEVEGKALPVSVEDGDSSPPVMLGQLGRQASYAPLDMHTARHVSRLRNSRDVSFGVGTLAKLSGRLSGERGTVDEGDRDNDLSLPFLVAEEGGVANLQGPSEAFSVSGSELSSSNIDPPELRVRQLAPDLFAEIRRIANVDGRLFARAFLATKGHDFSEGASGAFMCTAGGGRFIVKSMSQPDVETLQDILPEYQRYVSEHPDSLLIRFLLCVEITLYGNTMWYVVMNNIFPQQPVSERYDLKGAWINRSSNREKLDKPRKCKNCGTVMTHNRGKCLRAPQHRFDLVWRDLDFKLRLALPLDRARHIRGVLVRDSAFLRDLNIMDYSLLAGVHRTTRRMADIAGTAGPVSPSSPRERSGEGLVPCEIDCPDLWYIGVIDVLQRWTWKKRVERFLKTVFRCAEAGGLSAMPPHAYQQRFVDRVVNMAITDPHEPLEASSTPVGAPAKRS